jgi:alcohol dehydrogenase YqhD (iron-dependent ADH family)
MENFVYRNPTKVLFGKNTVEKIGGETAEYGKRVLLVSGISSAIKNGIYDTVTSSLESAGIRFFEHKGVSPNPTVRHTREGIQKAKKCKCEVVCAVGGGSVLDEAKAIGAGAVVEHDVWKFFTGKKSLKNTLPLTSIITLAASGSEMNSGMVLTNEETMQKFGFANRHLFPKTSILNPELTYSVPANYTAYGAVDAIAHLLEVYFTTKVSPSHLQDRLVEGLVLSIMESCDRVFDDPENYKARAELMWAASLTLNGLVSSGLGKVGFPMHLMEHSLSARHNTPHGAGLAVIIPGWLEYNAVTAPEKTAQFAERVFRVSSPTMRTRARLGVEKLKMWFRDKGCPVSLSELNISTEEIPSLAESSKALSKVWRMREYTPEIVAEVLRRCD